MSRIIFQINDVSRLGPRIGQTGAIRTLDSIYVRQSRVQCRKFIQQNLVSLRCLFLEIHLQDKTSLCIFLLIATRPTYPKKLRRLILSPFIYYNIRSSCRNCVYKCGRNSRLRFRIRCSPLFTRYEIQIVPTSGTETHSVFFY